MKKLLSLLAASAMAVSASCAGCLTEEREL